MAWFQAGVELTVQARASSTPYPTYTPMPTYTPYPTFTELPTVAPSATPQPKPVLKPLPTANVPPTAAVDILSLANSDLAAGHEKASPVTAWRLK
jgi:hypothetical protein